jgi:hypothetical protein
MGWAAELLAKVMSPNAAPPFKISSERTAISANLIVARMKHDVVQASHERALFQRDSAPGPGVRLPGFSPLTCAPHRLMVRSGCADFICAVNLGMLFVRRSFIDASKFT